nr:transposase [Yersinia frederiksenii]
MNQSDCFGKALKPWPIFVDHFKQGFTATAPNQKWAGELTYLWTEEGWVYPAVMMTCSIVPWCSHEEMTMYGLSFTRAGPLTF